MISDAVSRDPPSPRTSPCLGLLKSNCHTAFPCVRPQEPQASPLGWRSCLLFFSALPLDNAHSRPDLKAFKLDRTKLVPQHQRRQGLCVSAPGSLCVCVCVRVCMIAFFALEPFRGSKQLPRGEEDRGSVLKTRGCNHLVQFHAQTVSKLCFRHLSLPLSMDLCSF